MRVRLLDLLAAIVAVALLLALGRAPESRQDPILFLSPLVLSAILAGLLATGIVARYGPPRLRPALGGGLIIATAYLALTALPRLSWTIGADLVSTRLIQLASKPVTCLVQGIPRDQWTMHFQFLG